jgi:hypothetical protein
VFTVPLHSNASYSIVACVFVAMGMCLPSSCLAMNVYSDLTIPAFGRHVTIGKAAKPATFMLIKYFVFRYVVPFGRVYIQ